MLKVSKANKVDVKVVRDWEERLSLFLQDAIESPHREPEICEELINYVHMLVHQSKVVSLARVRKVLKQAAIREDSL